MNTHIKADELAAKLKLNGYNPFDNPFITFDLNVLKGDGIFLPGYEKPTYVGIHDFVIVSGEADTKHLLWYPLLNSDIYDEFNMIDTVQAFLFTVNKWTKVHIWTAGSMLLQAESNVGAPHLIITGSATSGEVPRLEIALPVLKNHIKSIEDYCKQSGEDEGFYFSLRKMFTPALTGTEEDEETVKVILREKFYRDNNILAS